MFTMNYPLFIIFFYPIILYVLIIVFILKNDLLGRKIFAALYVIYFVLVNFFTINFLNNKEIFFVKLYDIVLFEDFIVAFDFLINNTTAIMLYIVIVVSFLVSMFSLWYMDGDPNITKFLILINTFSMFMIILVSSNNIIIIFAGWEGIGLFSYLLINFWNTRTTANRSALKAILINKIGDCFYYAFIFLYWFIYRTFSVYESYTIKNICNNDSYMFSLNYNKVLFIFLLIASIAKSAQIILHVWLPDAMEGPTPVSALLHAATMVTAGIFILIKFNFLITDFQSGCLIVMWVGLLTNLMASFIAAFQNDIKKIIAYSTTSQIGIIYIAFGLNKFNLSLYHLLNHAYFKSFLFILAGIFIHFIYNKQDLRFINKVNYNVYFVYVCMLVASFSLISVPFLAGYYSKEFIITNSFINENTWNNISFYLLNLSAITTAIYSFKIMYFLFYSNNSLFIFRTKKNQKEEFDLYLFILLCVCAILFVYSIFIGFIFSSFNNFWFLNLTPEISDEFFNINNVIIEKHGESSPLLIIIEIILGFYVCWAIVFHKSNIYNNLFLMRDASLKKFYFNDLNYFIVSYFLNFNNILSKTLDKNFIESLSNFSNFKIYVYSFIKTTYFNFKFKIFCYFIFIIHLCVIIYFIPFMLVYLTIMWPILIIINDAVNYILSKIE